jgi:YaiO family outer membrane protein
LKKDSSDYEANNALIDFYLWSGDYDAGITAANNALSFYPRDIGLLEKKIKIYMASKNYEEARKTFRGIRKTDPGHQSISELRSSLYQTGYSNIFSVEHSLESFNEPYHRRWHISSFGYGRKTSAGVFYGKIYLGDVVRSGEGLFSNDVSAQYALELYPRINKQNYAFLNYAFSGGSNFPQDRVGVEFYHTFGKAIEGSLGYRYLYFNPDEGDKVHIHIYTGALSSYLGKYWISFRPFIVSDGTDTSHKYSISLRRFLQKEENYLELILGTGTSPDNPAFYTNGENVPKLGSWRAELLWKQRIFNNLIFEIQGGYEKTEYVSDSWRNQLAFRTSLSYVF